MSGIFWPSLLGKVIRTLITSDYQKSIETRFPRIENLRETCGHARPICSDFWKKKESICSLVCKEQDYTRDKSTWLSTNYQQLMLLWDLKRIFTGTKM